MVSKTAAGALGAEGGEDEETGNPFHSDREADWNALEKLWSKFFGAKHKERLKQLRQSADADWTAGRMNKKQMAQEWREELPQRSGQAAEERAAIPDVPNKRKHGTSPPEGAEQFPDPWAEAPWYESGVKRDRRTKERNKSMLEESEQADTEL